jgi:DNA-binding NarL/FixJ family response regulator
LSLRILPGASGISGTEYACGWTRPPAAVRSVGEVRPLPADLHLPGLTTVVVSVAAVAKISPQRQADWGTPLGDGVLSRRRFRAAVLAAAAADREHHVEQERLRVARDVHDVLAQTMSVVTLHAVFGALRAGAAGFLLKDVRPDDLRRAVRGVAAGGSILAPAVTGRVMTAAANGHTPSPERLDGLTVREREVLAAVAAGHRNAEIAGLLGIGEATARTHVGRLLSKLGARDRAQLVMIAYESGLVRPGDQEGAAGSGRLGDPGD